MPYYIVPFEDGYRVMSKSGAFFSQKPLPLTVAKRQQRALYAKEKNGDMYEGGSYTYMRHNGQPHFIMKGEGFFGDLFAKVKSVASNLVSSVATKALNVVASATSYPLRNDYPPKVRAILAQYGSGIVNELLLRREPIQGAVETALNYISLGRFAQVKKELNYDNVFHLSLIATITMPDQQQVRIMMEKNEVINMTTDIKPAGEQVEYLPIPVPCCITLNEMMARTQSFYGEGYFKYDAFRDNCQAFINTILTANELNTPRIHAFVLQDTASILKGLPDYVSPFANLTTNIAGLADRAIQGEGAVPKKNRRESRMMKSYGGVNLKGVMVGKGFFSKNALEEAMRKPPPRIPRPVLPPPMGVNLEGYGSFLGDVWNTVGDKVDKAKREWKDKGMAVLTGTNYTGAWNRLDDEYLRTHPPTDKIDEGALRHDLEYSRIAKLRKKGAPAAEIEQLIRKSDDEFLDNIKKHWRTNPWAAALGFAGIKGKNVAEDTVGLNKNLFVGEGIPSKFKAQLEKAGLSPEEYLRKARAAANREGYDGRALEFSDNGKNKLMIYDDEGKAHHFGRVGYGDYIIYSNMDKALAEKKRNTFHKSHSNIKGDWMNDKFSPNMLALKINW